jgi:hypothetical protein
MDILTEVIRPWQSTDYHLAQDTVGRRRQILVEVKRPAGARPCRKPFEGFIWPIANSDPCDCGQRAPTSALGFNCGASEQKQRS